MLLLFDVGGTFIKWGLMDRDFIIQEGKYKTSLDTFEAFTDVIAHIIKQNDRYEIEGLAFSLPGTIDNQKGFISQGGSLRYNDKRNFKAEIEEKFHIPVSIENDAKCAAIAEMNVGNLKDIKNGIVIVVGTGIGGSIISNGTIHTGAHGYAGELSLILTKDIYKNGLSSLLGNQIGMKSFLEKMKEMLENPFLTGEVFIQMVKEGNEKAKLYFDEYMDLFSQNLFSLQMIFDPERIVIGGGISEDAFFIQALQTKFSNIFKLFPIEIKHANIIACKYANQSNLIGAGIHFKKHRMLQN